MIEFVKKNWYWFAAGAVVLLPFGWLFLYPWIREMYEKQKQKPLTMGSDQTRGIRNNNPFNIRDSKTVWKGETTADLDKSFEEFESMIYGIRAGIRNARTHYGRGINTIRKLIATWAPSNENDTENYIKYVANAANMDENQVFKFDSETMFRIMAPMAKLESRLTITQNQWDEAWKLSI
jgi:asparagine N-glycosylation enzyme membrane subunit Stt3